MMDTQKTILVLPGTKWQVELVKKIKALGHKVIVVNPASDSPCFEYADEYLQSDIFNQDAVINFAKKYKIDAVVSDECDIAMNWIAELGEKLHLSVLSPETASLYTDKFKMREFSKSIGLKYPEFKICHTVKDAVDFQRRLGTPIIIKPTDSNASHGVHKCITDNDIIAYFDEALSFSRINKGVLAEQYINGTEFTIDGIKTPTHHFTLAISEKRHFKHNPNIANELYFTHHNPKFNYEELKKVNDIFVNSSDLKWGFTHAEYKYENGYYYLIEIAARGGGNMISSCITQHMSGHDTYKYLISCSLGETNDADFSIPSSHQGKAAVLKFFDTPKGGGIVKRIDGIEFLEYHPDIKFFQFNFKEGDVIQEAVNDSARIGFFIACSDNDTKLNHVIKEVEDKVKIII